MSADFTPEKEDLKLLSPFKMQVLTNFPYIEADFDALTNYQLLCKVVEYLNNTITEMNEVTEQTESLYNAYVSLQNYVNTEIGDFETTVNNRVDELESYMNNYFNNLDVQEEINNKLDAMTEDGTLTNLIKAYIDPIFNAYENEVNEVLSAQQAQITSLASGGPAGIYDTAEELATADPSHSRIYLVLADGKWYYYDTDLSTWAAGGTYQSTGIADRSISGIKTKFLDNSLNKVLIADDSGTVLTGVDYTISNGIITLDGTAASTGYLIINNLNDEVLNGVYRLSTFCNKTNQTGVTFNFVNADASLWYGSDTIIKGDMVQKMVDYVPVTLRIRIESGTELDNLILKPMITEDYDYNLISRTGFKKFDEVLESNTIYDIGNKVIKVDNTDFIQVGTNMIDPDKLYLNKLINGSTAGNLNLEANNSYNVYVIFNNSNVSKDYYIYPRYRSYYLSTFTNAGSPANTSVTTATSEPSIVTVPANTRIGVNFYSEDSKIMIAESSEAVPYEPFSYIIPKMNFLNNLKDSNILYGKKLVTCGDSFTQYTNATFDSGIYVGENKVWPYLIGLRNNMIVNNMAVSGSTMSINAYSQTNFADTLYTQIPNDADYIIIKYGINDNNARAPIGTIDSNDDTTFYGAWNKVLPYIIEHHPLAKIGIIVTNGLAYDSTAENGSTYATAIINIAKRYGIPTLNEWNDPNVPMLIRSGRADVPVAIRTIRDTAFRVSADNTHENYQCQEYESTFVEDFIRRL